MDRLVFETRCLSLLFVAGLVGTGCIFGTGSDGSTGSAVSDAGSDDAERVGADAVDTGGDSRGTDASDTGGDISCGPDAGARCDCNFENDSDGVCAEARRGSDGRCRKPEHFESSETRCDGLDNDCDGYTDEGCPCAYDSKSAGVCGTARYGDKGRNCQEPAAYETTETLCDGRDNDCDGDVDGADSDLQCSCDPESSGSRDCYTGPEGTAENGICHTGEQECTSSSTWGSCDGDQTPLEEGGGTNCDGKDNDCDGVVDEGCDCNFRETDAGVCKDQVRTTEGECPEPSRYEQEESSCGDGADNDCDGDVDCNDSDCEALPGVCF